MYLLPRIAFIAATFHTLSLHVHSRALNQGSLASRNDECLTADCPDLVPLSSDNSVKRDHGLIFDGLASLLKRGRSVGQKGQKPPNNDQNPKGDRNQNHNSKGQVAETLPEGSSERGDPGPTLVGDAKDSHELIDQARKIEEKPYSTSDNLNTTSFQQDFDNNYSSKTIEKQGSLESDDLEEPLKDVGYNSTENARYRETTIYPKVDETDPIATIQTFPDSGFLIGPSNFPQNNNNNSTNDNNNNSTAQASPFSDVIFNEWVSSLLGRNQSEKTDDGAKNLRAYIGRDIRSKSTVVAMQNAQRVTSTPLNATAMFKRAAGSQEERDAFLLMEGTDFVSGLGMMLKGHTEILGKKQISSIACYPRTFDGQQGRKNITITVNFEDV
ncbi:MAG: hypothetical protein Q9203_002431 [Teloschistes exilis]